MTMYFEMSAIDGATNFSEIEKVSIKMFVLPQQHCSYLISPLPIPEDISKLMISLNLSINNLFPTPTSADDKTIKIVCGVGSWDIKKKKN